MSRPRLHYHTDCAFFAGCESMLAVLFGDPSLRERWDAVLSYRRSDVYEAGLAARLQPPPPLLPLSLPDMDALVERLPPALRRPAAVLSRALGLHQLAALWSGLVLWRLFGRTRPAIVHVNNGGWPGAGSSRAAIVAARLRGAKTLCVVNNIAIDYGPPRRWPDWPLDRLAARCADRWVVANREGKAALVSVLRLDPERVSVIANGIPPRRPAQTRESARRRLGVPEGRVAFASVALLEDRKGHVFLLEALARLAKERAPDRMPLALIEGDGEGLPALKERAASLGVEDFARFVGREKNVFDLLGACDALVETSIYGSPSPNVVAESMGLGLPVVGSAHSSQDQIESGKDGLLVDPRDTPALAEALARLTDDPGLRSRLGTEAKASFQRKFSPASAAAAYSRLYEELAAS